MLTARSYNRLMPTCPRRLLPRALPWFLLAAAACGGDPDVVTPPGDGGGGNGGTSSSSGDGGGFVGSMAASGGAGGESGCEGVSCRADQHCEEADGQGTCV